MISRMPFRIRTLCLAFGALVPLAFAGAVNAAANETPATVAASPAATTTEPLEQLKEAFVHGKRLATEIARTEDDLYYLYNRLNKNHDYDIVCGDMSIERGSLITKRVCVPGFVVDEMLNRAPIPSFSNSSYSYDTCTSSSYSVGQDLNGGSFYQANCVRAGGTGFDTTTGMYSPDFGSFPVAYSESAMAQVYVGKPVSQDRRQAYADNVMKVIHSDLRLTKTATRLAGLYGEMNTVQANYAQRKAEDRAAHARAAAKPNLGPRAM